MVPPIRISCPSDQDLPTVFQIQSWTADGSHVVLHIPPCTRARMASVVAKLAKKLPEFSVFDSGGNAESECVTILPVVSTEIVHAHQDDIKIAVDKYRGECWRLMELYRSGSLPDCYSADEHGEHCCFTHKLTGQIVEAPLIGFVDDIVDPFFFALFVKSTPECSVVASMIRHNFHDTLRMLDIVYGSPNELR